MIFTTQLQVPPTINIALSTVCMLLQTALIHLLVSYCELTCSLTFREYHVACSQHGYIVARVCTLVLYFFFFHYVYPSQWRLLQLWVGEGNRRRGKQKTAFSLIEYLHVSNWQVLYQLELSYDFVPLLGSVGMNVHLAGLGSVMCYIKPITRVYKSWDWSWKKRSQDSGGNRTYNLHNSGVMLYQLTISAPRSTLVYKYLTPHRPAPKGLVA